MLTSNKKSGDNQKIKLIDNINIYITHSFMGIPNFSLPLFVSKCSDRQLQDTQLCNLNLMLEYHLIKVQTILCIKRALRQV